MHWTQSVQIQVDKLISCQSLERLYLMQTMEIHLACDYCDPQVSFFYH